jgi:hypothetical protein
MRYTNILCEMKEVLHSKIRGFLSGVTENSRLQGSYGVSTGKELLTSRTTAAPSLSRQAVMDCVLASGLLHKFT